MIMVLEVVYRKRRGPIFRLALLRVLIRVSTRHLYTAYFVGPWHTGTPHDPEAGQVVGVHGVVGQGSGHDD